MRTALPKDFLLFSCFTTMGKKNHYILKKKTRKVNTADKGFFYRIPFIPDHRTYRTYAYYNSMVFNTEY